MHTLLHMLQYHDHFRGGGVGDQLLMLSPDILKSQIPIFEGGGGWWPTFRRQLQNFKVKSWAEISISGRWGWGGGVCPNLLKSKQIFTRGFAEKFLSFRAKKCLGMVLDFEYFVYANHKKKNRSYQF